MSGTTELFVATVTITESQERRFERSGVSLVGDVPPLVHEKDATGLMFLGEIATWRRLWTRRNEGPEADASGPSLVLPPLRH